MLESFASSSVGVAVGVSLLALLLVYGIGCVWPWKRREATAFTLPKFMQRRRRSSRHKYCTNPLGLSAHMTGSNPKPSEASKGQNCTTKRNSMHSNYENVEAATDEETQKALYENTQPSNLEEPVYCNQTDAFYCNFQKPSPPVPQDEDIYILPDSY